jgi:diguanylate cyclase (GGDEF)-like protein
MTATPAASGWRPRILAIDDAPENIRLVGRILKPMADVSFALGGVEGLKRAATLRPDLILLDVDMPDMGGYEVLRALKDAPLTADIPVVFLTGHDDQAREAAGLDLGANDYIAKPFSPGVVAARVRTQIRLLEYARRLGEMNAELERLATTDPLTGLQNRRAFVDVAQREMLRTRRFGETAAVAMLDVDHFKHVNDRFGHDAGDAVLVEVGRRMDNAIRRTDVLARMGGEEFAVLMPKTDMEGAAVVAARLLDYIRSAPVDTAAGPVPITATMGVTMIRADDADISAPLKRADLALYEGKGRGRDRVVTI